MIITTRLGINKRNPQKISTKLLSFLYCATKKSKKLKAKALIIGLYMIEYELILSGFDIDVVNILNIFLK